MTEGYFISIFAICSALGLLGLLSYDRQNRAERAVMGVILLYVVLSPLAEVWRGISEEGFAPDGDLLPEVDSEEYDEMYGRAVADGILRAVADKFSLSEDDVTVKVYGYVPAEGRCAEIRILLSGRAALADNKSVKKYVESLEMGDCKIEIEL